VPSASWYLRALRLGEALGRARDRAWMTAIVAAGEVRDALVADDRVWALRMILQCRDHLRAAFELADGAPEVASAWEAAPELVGAEEWDRLLAGVIEHEFDIRGWPAPAWTAALARPAGAGEEWWLFGSPFFTEAEVRAATPGWLAERGIFIAARDLVTA
jgi:hypothetical protein